MPLIILAAEQVGSSVTTLEQFGKGSNPSEANFFLLTPRSPYTLCTSCKVKGFSGFRLQSNLP